MTDIPRAYTGPAVLSQGFRLFFLMAAAWSALEVLAWLPMFRGDFALPTAFGPRDWHVHELLFGFLPAVIAGFLLTAVPNWTGRLPLRGAPLAGLALLWLAGRYAVAFSGRIGALGAAAIDSAFLVVLTLAIAREILASGNRRNLKIVALLGLLAAANVGFHVEAYADAPAAIATRAGLALVLTLVMVIGGRIIPSFTRNWLMRQAPGRLPAPFDRFDVGCLAISAAALVAWVAMPEAIATGAALVVAAALNAARLARWAGERTASDRLVLVLHVAYAFVPLGFLMVGLSALEVLPPSAGIHAWTAGAMGLMTLAVMSRASLGHTGRPLVASPALQAIYAAALVAAVLRIVAVLLPDAAALLLALATVAWVGAFAGFAALYAPFLLRGPRKRRVA